MILIVSGQDDVHTQCVLWELKALGKQGAVLDTALFGKGVLLSEFVATSSIVECPALDLSLRSEDIESVWLRRPGRFDFVGVVRDEYLDFIVREWREAFWGWLDHLPARFVNPLVAQERATKLLQIQVAKEVGLRTPVTCMTNDPATFAAFVDRFDGRVVHKTMTQLKSMMLETKAWSPDDGAHLSHLPLAPTIVQERILGPEDVRVTVIGKQLFSARMETPEDVVDSRVVGNWPYEVCLLPDQVEDKILRLMERLNLSFGTIDLKVADDGDLIFLEVNPQGQFAYIEIVTGMPLLASFARFIAGVE